MRGRGLTFFVLAALFFSEGTVLAARRESLMRRCQRKLLALEHQVFEVAAFQEMPARNVLELQDKVIDFDNSWIPSGQILLTPGDFRANERRIIGRILEMSRKKSNVEAANRLGHEFEEFMTAVQTFLMTRQPLPENARQGFSNEEVAQIFTVIEYDWSFNWRKSVSRKVRDFLTVEKIADLRKRNSLSVKRPNPRPEDFEVTDEVEVGAFQVKTVEGRVHVMYLTSRHSGIIVQGFERLGEFIAKKGIPYEEIVSVDFFHNHPGDFNSPLSEGDVKEGASLKEKLEKSAGHEIEVSIAGIQKRGNLVLIYQSPAR